VAGAFYPEDAVDLAHLIESLLEGSHGPVALPTRHRAPERHLRAMIVPHAGYRYSGAVAAHAFAALATERPPEVVLLLGVNHRGRGAPAALSTRDWRTPLGIVPRDAQLAAALERPPIAPDDAAHATEHSIEVELPFLQYALPHPTIAALSVSFGPMRFLREVAGAVRRAVRGREALLLASTDFSHYVSPERAERDDRTAIDRILARDPEGLYETVRRSDISMCGIAPTTVLLAALEEEALDARLLRWGHSGEVEAMREVVGYASILLESREPLGATP
jgi:MEMO1 family protein